MKNISAFPVILGTYIGDDGNTYTNISSGMTLRDYFAGEAIHGSFLSSSEPSHIASWAYEIADAMLAEREKGEER